VKQIFNASPFFILKEESAAAFAALKNFT